MNAWEEEQARIAANADPDTAGAFEQINRESLVIEPLDLNALLAGKGQESGEWLVEPLIPMGRQVALFSEAKSGKSLLSLEIAAALATGRPVLAKAAGPPMTVIYIDQEMTPEDLRERLVALGYSTDDDLSSLVYFQLVDLPALDTAMGGLVVEQLLDRYDPALFILDTMSSVVGGAEDDSDTYRDFYRHTGRLLKEREVPLLRLDHSGKDGKRGQRGSSAKADDVDVVFQLTAKANDIRLCRTHSRIPWVPLIIDISRDTEPVLRHSVTSGGFKKEAIEVARLLDTLHVPLDASGESALVVLREAGQGKHKGVILDALKLRRQRA